MKEGESSYYDSFWEYKSKEKRELNPFDEKLFEPYLRDAKSALDYGCGNGERYGKFISSKVESYLGCDVSARAVEEARTMGLDAQLFGEDGHVPSGDEQFDIAFCIEVLEHLLNPELALADIRRCLKANGILIVTVPNAAFWRARVEFLLTGFLCPGGGPATSRVSPWNDPHIRFFSISMLKKLANVSGFKPTKVVGSPFSLGLLPVVWRKPRLRRGLDTISKPLCFLSFLRPSLFSPRIYLICKKT